MSEFSVKNFVKTSKHKKELRETSVTRFEHGLGVGYKCGNLDTLDYLNQLNKISKEEAIANSVDFDNFINEQFHENDVLLQHYNDSSKNYQEDFEIGLN